MKSRLLTCCVPVALALMIAGCASHSPASGSAWDRYVQFDKDLEEEGLDLNFEPYFTRYAYADVAEASPEDLPYVKEMLAYPQYFGETYSHIEKADGSRRCLTVNGKTSRGDIGSLSIEFIQDNGLRMNDANLLFVDSADELPRQAQCPDESRFQPS